MRLDHARRVRGLAARVAAFALVFGLAAGCNALLGMTDVTERSAAATSSTTASMGDGGRFIDRSTAIPAAARAAGRVRLSATKVPCPTLASVRPRRRASL